MKRFDAKFVLRILFYLFGMFVLALGVRVAVNADLGISPVSSTPRAIYFSLLSHRLDAVHLFGNTLTITYGMCVAMFNGLCMLVQILVLRRTFKLTRFFQLFVSFIFGFFIDFAGWIVGAFTFPSYVGRLVMLVLSIFIIAVGISFYLGAKLIPMATEGMGLAITDKLKKYPYHKVKIGVDTCFVLLALTLMLVFTGGPAFTPPGAAKAAWVVREGTVVTALTVGLVMGWIKPVFDKIFACACFGESKTPADK